MINTTSYSQCEVCGKHRSKRIHSKCSRILQQRYNDPVYRSDLDRIAKQERYENTLESLRYGVTCRIRRASQG